MHIAKRSASVSSIIPQQRHLIVRLALIDQEYQTLILIALRPNRSTSDTTMCLSHVKCRRCAQLGMTPTNKPMSRDRNLGWAAWFRMEKNR